MTRTRKRLRSSDPLPSDILATLPALDVEVDRVASNEAWALCPGHEAVVGRRDNKASWSINLDTGEHNCFSCGWGGRYMDLVVWQQGLSKDRDAEEKASAWIRKHGGIAVAASRIRGERAYTKKQAEEVSEADMAFFEDPPKWARTERDLALESCRAYGVKFDLDKEQWILPVREPFTNRLLGWQAKGGRFFNNHPEGLEKSKTVFGHHLLRGVKVGYLEESPLDAVRLHTYLYDGAVSGYGVHVSPFQMELIVDEVDTLYVCLDNDAAGRAKSKRIWKEYRHRARLMFANYENTDKKDHGEMTPEEIEESLRRAHSSLRFGRRVDR